MSLIIREPSNPLANALGVLSQQILADAASRKEREFRAQEIAKERTFMSGENAAERESRISVADKQAANNLAMQQLLIGSNERIANTDKEMRIEIARLEKEGREADARALSGQWEAQKLLAQGQLKALDAEIEQRKRLDDLAFGDGSGNAPPLLRDPSRTVTISPSERRTAGLVGINLPAVASASQADSLAGILSDRTSPLGSIGWAISNPIDALSNAFDPAMMELLPLTDTLRARANRGYDEEGRIGSAQRGFAVRNTLVGTK